MHALGRDPVLTTAQVLNSRNRFARLAFSEVERRRVAGLAPGWSAFPSRSLVVFVFILDVLNIDPLVDLLHVLTVVRAYSIVAVVRRRRRLMLSVDCSSPGACCCPST